MKTAAIAKKLDQLYEFDREPVKEKNLQGIGNFLGIFAGEHIAGTEFVIGMLFVAHGVTVRDMLLGALIGNILAVLSWAYITSPIAVKVRLSLYWHLKKIAGPVLVFIYNIVNALMFCFLAGAMVAVSATAVGIPFHIQMPELNDFYPNSVGWVVTVIFVGAVITVVAIMGFESLARIARVSAPWMFLIFVAAAIASIGTMDVDSFGELRDIARTKIWSGIPLEGQSKFTMWHVIFFTWLANAAMHLGMADLTLFRYAKKWQYGFASAIGMFLGHYIAWISSGIIYAAAMYNNFFFDAPGPLAYNIAGIAGAVCVVVAGWTTANPTLYRAGLALQVASPNWSRWKVTLIAGMLTTVAALFPALVMKLLEFVAIYGLILLPMGAVIFADYYLIPKIGLTPCYAENRKINFNWAAGITWFGLLLLALVMNRVFGVEVFFLGPPVWILGVVTYLVISKIYQKRTIISA